MNKSNTKLYQILTKDLRGMTPESDIHHYEVKDHEIVIKKYDGTETSIPFTKEEEDKILDLMHNQAVYRTKAFDRNFPRNVVTICLEDFFCTYFSVIDFKLLTDAMANISSGSVPWELISFLYALVFVLATFLTFRAYYETVKLIQQHHQAKKEKFYLDHYDLMNQADLLEEIKGEEQLNMNTLHHFSLSELKMMRNYLDASLVVDSDLEEESSKTRQLKRMNHHESES